MVAFMIVIVVLAGILVSLCFFLSWIKRLRVEAVNALRVMVGDDKVYHVEDCNFFGILSKGYAQVRGNGVLALTDKGIHFRMLLPSRYLFIPMSSVRGVSRSRSFLGKTKARTLLRVDFVSDGGEEDACAWLVPSLDWWLEAIEAVRAGKESPPAPWARG